MAKERIEWDDLQSLTPDNRAIKSLKDLLVMTNFVDEDLERFYTLRQNVHNGDKLGWVGTMEDGVGTVPVVTTYKNAAIEFAEKEWSIEIGRFLSNGVTQTSSIPLQSIV